LHIKLVYIKHKSNVVIYTIKGSNSNLIRTVLVRVVHLVVKSQHNLNRFTIKVPYTSN